MIPKKFLYYQSIIQYRIPINEDGTLGNPEVTKKFTSPIKGAKEYNKPKTQVTTLYANINPDEVVEL